MFVSAQNIQPVLLSDQVCSLHHKKYQLIGIDDICQENCRICVDCLRSLTPAHKRGLSHHPTITIEELTLHFQKLQSSHHQSIANCREALNKYISTLQTMLKNQITRQSNRLNSFINKMLLSSMTRDSRKLQIAIDLASKHYEKLTCKQVGEVIQQLFQYTPPAQNQAYQMFTQYMAQQQKHLQTRMHQIAHSSTWNHATLSNIDQHITLAGPLQRKIQLRTSRVRTQEDSSKRTIRRSVRKAPKLKQMPMQLRKPLQLKGSKLVQGRQEAIFMAKLFQNKNITQTELLFRASQHDFSIRQFHRYCDGHTHTLVLVRTQFGKTIGGFTPVPWRSTANTLHSDIRQESFLFSLSLKQKMELVDEKSAVFNSMNFGPTFGAGADLAICHNANSEKTSYSQFPYSYANGRYKQSNQHSTALFTGQRKGNHFLIKEWEVWKVYFSE